MYTTFGSVFTLATTTKRTDRALADLQRSFVKLGMHLLLLLAARCDCWRYTSAMIAYP
jgi:hypothetical protein